MNPARQNKNCSDFAPGTAFRFWNTSRRLRTIAALAVFGVFGVFLAIGRAAAAQITNAPAATHATGYSSFQIITERNIFDPNRYARTSHSRRHSTSPSAPSFSLVGTMNYRKGMIAFFDGNDTDYRKVLSPDGVIAGYKVVGITQRGITLEAAGKPVVMKVGAQMRQAGKGEWQLAGADELPVATTGGNETQTADETSATNPVPGSADEPNDVLKKLMQKREQELK